MFEFVSSAPVGDKLQITWSADVAIRLILFPHDICPPECAASSHCILLARGRGGGVCNFCGLIFALRI